MTMTRRNVMVMGAGAFVALGLPMQASAAAEDAISEFTGGADVASEGVTLRAPEIAENGNTVPIEIDAPGAEAVLILAMGNPTPGVAQFNFGPLAASQSASTRIRLAGTQDVVAVARMKDGSFAQASSNIKVTIGGCGG